MNDFMKLVLEMRTAQKRYFLNRGRIDLDNSKKLERQVDRFLNEFDEPTLFEKATDGSIDE